MGNCLSCFNSDQKFQPQTRILENPLNITLNSPLNLEASIEMKSPNRGRTMDFQISFEDLCKEKPGKINLDYTLMHPPIGKGSFGEVRRAIHKLSGLKRAIKIIPKKKCTLKQQKRILNEVEILKKLDHPNIVKVYEFYQDEKNIYIVTELCSGGELFFKIMQRKFFKEKKAAIIIKQILSAVFYCHEHKIAHRDIKPENILFEEESNNSLLKIIDFGSAREFLPSQKMREKIGTTYYMAPEVLSNKYDEKCDVWSCGVILYLLLCGYPPFNGASPEIIYGKIVNSPVDFSGKEWNNVSEQGKSFILKLLNKEPEQRLSAEEALQNKWLKKLTRNTVSEELINRALKNLLEFQCDRKLQEFTWTFFVNNFCNNSDEEKNQILQVFQSLDLDGDGTLSKEELITAYKKILGKNKEVEEKVEKILGSLDINNNGNLDYSEFLIGTLDQEHFLTKQRLASGFKMFDKDQSGTISLDELKEVFGGEKISNEDWKEIINEVDENQDGEIQFDEFENMMKNFLTKERKESMEI